jgi:hypothetical protein
MTATAGITRATARLAIVSREEPDRVHAVLTRAGLIDVSHLAVDDEPAAAWLVRALGRD